ncbi:MAG: YgiW/YdeI family stress tolerance OB fold protein [Spirochaetia bacterium]|nr:YgiW/YdeI family stress tolerance OB fold protein [Spirochaetia bacterium]
MKRIIAVLVLAIVCAGFACAQGFNGGQQAYGGGFQDNGSSATAATAVKEALRMRDESYVTVRGNIVKRLTDDKYLFRDATGEIVVDIDNEDWAGVTVGPNDTVELSGEIDRDFNKVEIDVGIVRKVN